MSLGMMILRFDMVKEKLLEKKCQRKRNNTLYNIYIGTEKEREIFFKK